MRAMSWAVGLAAALTVSGYEAASEPAITMEELCEAYAQELIVAPSSYERKFLQRRGNAAVWLEFDSVNEYGATNRSRVVCLFDEQRDENGLFPVESITVNGDTIKPSLDRAWAMTAARVYFKHGRK